LEGYIHGNTWCSTDRIDGKRKIMSKKKSFVLRIDPETFAQIEKWAADEIRSVNGQLECMMHKSLKDAKRLKKRKPGDDS
jgi:hypothetical protein